MQVYVIIRSLKITSSPDTFPTNQRACSIIGLSVELSRLLMEGTISNCGLNMTLRSSEVPYARLVSIHMASSFIKKSVIIANLPSSPLCQPTCHWTSRAGWSSWVCQSSECRVPAVPQPRISLCGSLWWVRACRPPTGCCQAVGSVSARF